MAKGPFGTGSQLASLSAPGVSFWTSSVNPSVGKPARARSRAITKAQGGSAKRMRAICYHVVAARKTPTSKNGEAGDGHLLERSA
jgi:hypothetical protein